MVFTLGFNTWAGLLGSTRSCIGELTADAELVSGDKKYSFKAGDVLMASAWFAHRNGEAFEDPEAFVPRATPSLQSARGGCCGPMDATATNHRSTARCARAERPAGDDVLAALTRVAKIW
ncbi:MAG: hypothetical protein ACI9MC_002487 [Kiritimatiellia bacterium]|jgi:hypothetical protein